MICQPFLKPSNRHYEAIGRVLDQGNDDYVLVMSPQRFYAIPDGYDSKAPSLTKHHLNALGLNTAEEASQNPILYSEVLWAFWELSVALRFGVHSEPETLSGHPGGSR